MASGSGRSPRAITSRCAPPIFAICPGTGTAPPPSRIANAANGAMRLNRNLHGSASNDVMARQSCF
jgi:hypothetical protein